MFLMLIRKVFFFSQHLYECTTYKLHYHVHGNLQSASYSPNNHHFSLSLQLSYSVSQKSEPLKHFAITAANVRRFQ